MSYPTTVTSHKVGDYAFCRRYFYWKHIRRVRFQGENIDLVSGSALAAGINTIDLELFNGVDLEDAMRAGQFKAMCVWYDELADPLPMHPKGLGNVLRALEEYYTVWPPETDAFSIAVEDGKPCIEWSENAPIGVDHPDTSEPLLWNIRYDKRCVMGDMLGIVDDKSTKRVSDQWVRKFSFDSQMLGYVYVSRMNGYACDFILIRAIEFTNTGPICTESPLITPEEHLIESWHKAQVSLISESIERYRNNDWPGNHDWRCATCAYFDLCTSSDPESMIFVGEAKATSLEIDPELVVDVT